MPTIIEIDKQYFDCCSLVASEHISQSLGCPIDLPPAIQESLEDHTAEDNLLALFNLIKGCEYERVVRDNSYNYETDLDQFFIYSVFAPAGAGDWLWQRDCFVVIEMGDPGDPRYVNYNAAEVYDMGDTMIAECGFFDWSIGWLARYFSYGEANWESDKHLEDINEEITTGSSSSPTYYLGQLCYSDPIWVEKLQGFVARPKDSKRPMVFFPLDPPYGG